jgi:hypothetical protein
MKAQIVNGNIVVTIEMQEPTPSASGKTLVVATTRGNVTTEVMVDGKPVTIGMNAYVSADNRPYQKNEEKAAVVKGNELIVTIPMQAAAPSASGKTMVVGTTRGNIVTNANVTGKNIVLGFNAYYHN